MAGFSVIRTPSGGSTRYWEFRRCILVTIQPLATSWQAADTGRRQQLTTKHQQNPPQTVKRSSQPAAGNRPLPAGLTLRQRHTGNILEPAPRRGTNFVADVRRDRSRAKARPTLIRVHSCSFVVQKHPAPNPPSHTKPPHPPLSLRTKKHRRVFQTDLGLKPELSPFVSIRVHSWFKTPPPALVYRFPSVASQARPSATSRGRLHCCSHRLWLRLWFCQKDRPSP